MLGPLVGFTCAEGDVVGDVVGAIVEEVAGVDVCAGVVGVGVATLAAAGTTVT